ncbi:MAG TPA: hypothetical protein VF595_00400 [Tepidisphaeraceae bacterium]|jgi:hypothetical protein
MNARPALLLFALSTLALGRTAVAQSSSALINEALDKLIDLNLDTTLPQALQTIEEKTAVPIRASSTVYDILPWGDQTKLTAKISNQTLRQALTAITAKLGLRFIVGDQAVELHPMPALTRLARRCTVDELTALDVLASLPYPDTKALVTMEKLSTDIDSGLAAAKTNYVIDGRVTEDVGKQTVRLPRGASYLSALEEMHRQTRATWYPSGRTVVVVQKEQLVQNLLSRPITVRFNGVDVAQVLTELARLSGVEFSIEPGAVQRVAPESRVIKLELENASTRQAMESIAAFTGLHYVQSDGGVYVWNPASNPVARRPERVAGIVMLDNGLQILLPENELPPDVLQYLQAKKAKTINGLREQMKKEGFKPTTQASDG